MHTHALPASVTSYQYYSGEPLLQIISAGKKLKAQQEHLHTIDQLPQSRQHSMQQDTNPLSSRPSLNKRLSSPCDSLLSVIRGNSHERIINAEQSSSC